MAWFGKTLLAATALMSAASASATVVVFTADPFNGPNAPGAQTVTTWNIAVPAGLDILSATFISTFGNTTNPRSAVGNVTVGGILVGTCPTDGDCTTAPSGFPTTISYSFLPSEFDSLVGSVSLVYDQTGCCRPRLGTSTLTLTFGQPVAVPEPQSWVLLIAGFGLVGAAMRRRSTASA